MIPSTRETSRDIPNATLPARFGLGPWQVQVALDEVSAEGRVHRLEPRSMRLLVALAQAGGELVTADTLLDAVWPGIVVTPSSLYDAVAQLRKVLGPEHIATVPRKGYRLATPVSLQAAAAETTGRGLGPRSVAVLPFGTQGLPETLGFLSESLTGDLIAELSRQPGLTVVARGTMLTLGQSHLPPQQLALELGARFVVDGLIALRDDTLRLSVQVADGWRGTQTWADTVELPVTAWHATATVVVGRLARALHFELNDLAAHPASSVGDLELQARAFSAQAWVQLFARPQTRETNEAATALAGRALALAPRLAQAWMCEAFCDWRAATYGWSEMPIAEQRQRALARAERAVELDPRDPDAHYVLGLVAVHHSQLLRAEEAFHHCLRLASSFAPAHGLLGMVRQRRGFPAETAAHCDRAFALSPREPLRAIWHASKGQALLDLDDLHGALEEVQRGLAVNPAFPQLYLIGAAAAQALGAHAQASTWVALLRERTAFCSVAALRLRQGPAYAPAAQHSFERLVDLLRQAGLPET